MKCIIECVQPFKNKFQIITFKEGKIYFDDGRYERIILNNFKEVEEMYLELCKIVFSWKQEYIGDRVYDGEKYLIEFDANHKRKKYKIQNKFPANWDEFLSIREKILELDEV
jgi:hypothetical protein